MDEELTTNLIPEVGIPGDIARVMMPERGLFSARWGQELGLPPPVGTVMVASLNYGLDYGRLVDITPYDPARHGAKVPAFHVVRRLGEEDAKTLDENKRLTESMKRTFLQAMGAHDIRIIHARLSFGRGRLFVRFTAPTPRLSTENALNEIRRVYSVQTNAWQVGPRDEVAITGAMGPCGRVCCCNTWLPHYPIHFDLEGVSSVSANGVCGRYKCCLAFTEKCATMQSQTENVNATVPNEKLDVRNEK